MTPEQYHSKFFPGNIRSMELGLRTYACARQESVFECPKRPPASSLEELKIAVIKTRYARLVYSVLLGRDSSGTWHELAICSNQDALRVWRDVHYASVVAKV